MTRSEINQSHQLGGRETADLSKTPRAPARWRYNLLLVALLAASGVMNVTLAAKVRQLYQRTIQLNGAIQELTDRNQVQAGEWVPPIEARDRNGQPVLISYSKKAAPTILYVFSPQCDWCNRNLRSVKALANQTAAEYRFVGLSLSDRDLDQYVAQRKLDFPIYRNPTNETLSSYKLGRTPQTIVISSDGRLVKNWQGAYVGNTIQQLEQFFGIKLPAVTSR